MHNEVVRKDEINMDGTVIDMNPKLKKFGFKWIIIGIVLLIVMVGAVLSFYGEYISIKELGDEYLSVFLKNIVVKTSSVVVSFLIVFAVFFINTSIIKRLCSDMISLPVNYLQRRGMVLLISVIVSVFASTKISMDVYNTFLPFLNSVSFGINDPVFGNDIGYYIFVRPFLDGIVKSGANICFFVSIYTIIAYALIYIGDEELGLKYLISDKKPMLHIMINIVVFFVFKAFTYRFISEEILYSSVAGVTGAGYTDVTIWLGFYKVIPYILMLLVVVSIVFAMKGKYRNVLYTAAVYPLLFVAVSVVAFGVQSLIVVPNESVKEAEYIGYNIEYTKKAYNIDNVTETEFPADTNLTETDIHDYKSVLDNVRITDYTSTVTAYNSLQGIRNFYRFNDADVSKYTIDGKKTLTMVSARELNLQGLDRGAKNYTNSIYRYTHGFGTVMSPLNRVTPEGQPEFLINNIPPKSYGNAPEITEPRIYYGEIPNNQYSIVNSAIKEIDYIDGSTAQEYSYKGSGGIQLTPFNKLVFAIKNSDFQMLISSYIKSDSRILINRNVAERVQKAIPFISFDKDPYLVIDGGGRLKWIVDGYTTSSYYPYSQRRDGINYIRNSVKAVVDAYNGDIRLYVVDKEDPVVQSYMKIYPSAFRKEELPADIREHIVYPETLFKIQAEMYGKYHVSDVNTFYNKSDSWIFAKEKYYTEIQDIEPYYNMLKIDEMPLTDENFVIMVPYTLQGKENMQSWFAASCDYENYGQMVSYQFPKGKNVYGTQQIESRIDNDANISQKITLWDQSGSNVIRGNTLVVPVKSSLIYIEPLYITASDSAGAIPELKQVIACYGDKIVMERTLEDALERIFNTEFSNEQVAVDDSDNNEQTETVTKEDIINSVIDAYDSAMNSNKSGNWEKYGRDMQALEEEIDRLRQYK